MHMFISRLSVGVMDNDAAVCDTSLYILEYFERCHCAHPIEPGQSLAVKHSNKAIGAGMYISVVLANTNMECRYSSLYSPIIGSFQTLLKK